MEGKVAIVAGGSRDIGRAVSLALAEAGARVVVNYFNNAAAGQETVESIRQAGGTATAVAGDMTRRGDVEKLVAETRRAFGDSIDVLVNVVGGMVARKPLPEMDEEFLEHVLRLNVTSTFLTTQCVLPHMAEGGSIVNLASQAGRDGGGPGAAAYSTSKGAVMSLTRAMAKELGPSGIRVNCVCPGMIDTTFHDTFTKDAVRANVAAGTPLRREGESREVADLVAYLASSRASFITGASFDINGGTFFS
ncbi:MAG: glucose 1-dehydrogenase [Gammaproteobacteria bacterium]|nr:glucose 1-dehydrogenase [Chromatiales bacterium]MYA29775.1 glucose 1-dehydrogenase [Gammaproteobacteria bacterium]MYE47962.1 glucose 1-dehydrogenase [Gammaproteobacteria bacterium]MYF67130.1 glucose 1-dehydrogenase [Gammaproteobacteria bacterium]MYK36563.1 glucose 1-dehydrogenase [Gammaproteobacteria bacterium]